MFQLSIKLNEKTQIVRKFSSRANNFRNFSHVDDKFRFRFLETKTRIRLHDVHNMQIFERNNCNLKQKHLKRNEINKNNFKNNFQLKYILLHRFR